MAYFNTCPNDNGESKHNFYESILITASPDSYYDGLNNADNNSNNQTSTQPTVVQQYIDSTNDTIGNLSPLLLMAPGLKPRNDARSIQCFEVSEYRSYT